MTKKIKIDGTEDRHLTKEELIAIRDWFLSINVFEGELEGWTLKELEIDEFCKDDFVVNYGGTLISND